MGSSTAWIIFVSLIVIIFIGIGIYFQFNSIQPVDINKVFSSNLYGPIARWGDIVPVVGEGCKGYKYPVTLNSGGTLKVGTPTLNKLILDNPGDYNITVTDAFSCLDSDLLNAIKVEHTCGVVDNYSCDDKGKCVATIRTTGTPPANGAGCRALNGSIVPFGQKETFYTTCKSDTQYGFNTKNIYCPGQIGGISIGFHATSPMDFPCLVKNIDGTIGTTNATGCDLSDPDQQFQLIQTTPGSVPSPSTVQGQQGNTGIISAFIDRDTGKCIIPSADKSSLVLGDCNPFNGYVWALIPPIVYDKNVGASAQQIVYVGDGNIKDFFKLTLNSPDDLYNYLTSINGLSMSNVSNTISLKPYTKAGFPGTSGAPQGKDRNAQIASFLLYNAINTTNTFTPF